jgi:hypothetical protein
MKSLIAQDVSHFVQHDKSGVIYIKKRYTFNMYSVFYIFLDLTIKIINYQLSIINYQLSIINYQLSIISPSLFWSLHRYQS